jgi:small redox-active disulfide protein 2
MLIKILGTGCPKCHRLEQLTREMADELNITAQFEHVTDMGKIMEYPVIGTPALVINEEVKTAGRMPSKEEIKAWLIHV